jgi:hypothetical protein
MFREEVMMRGRGSLSVRLRIVNARNTELDASLDSRCETRSEP